MIILFIFCILLSGISATGESEAELVAFWQKVGACRYYFDDARPNWPKGQFPCIKYCETLKGRPSYSECDLSGLSNSGLSRSELRTELRKASHKDDEGYLWVPSKCKCENPTVEAVLTILVEAFAEGMQKLINVFCGIILQTFQLVVEVGIDAIPGGAQLQGATKAAVRTAKTFAENGMEAGQYMNWVGGVCGIPDWPSFDVFDLLIGAPDSVDVSQGCGRKDKSGCRKLDPKPDPPKKPNEPPKKPNDPPKSNPPPPPPKSDPPKSDPPKSDPPKSDPPKSDPPKSDPPKSDPPKTSSPPRPTQSDDKSTGAASTEKRPTSTGPVSTTARSSQTPTQTSAQTTSSSAAACPLNRPDPDEGVDDGLDKRAKAPKNQNPKRKSMNTIISTECGNAAQTTHEFVITSLSYAANARTTDVARTCERKWSQACYHYQSAIAQNPSWSRLTCPQEAATKSRDRLNAKATDAWSKQHKGAGWQDARYRQQLRCDRDEYPPAYLLSETDVAFKQAGKDNSGQLMRWLPANENGGAQGMWASICFKVPLAELTPQQVVDAAKSKHFSRTINRKSPTSTEYTLGITVEHRPVFTIAAFDVPPAPDAGLRDNPCWPKQITDDPGFVLLTYDNYYANNPPKYRYNETYEKGKNGLRRRGFNDETAAQEGDGLRLVNVTFTA